MKKLLLSLFIIPTFTIAQYNIDYTVTIKRLKALADNCDGGIPLCLNAPQDPVFSIWTTDAEANTNTNCWIFEDDDAAGYNQWIDIQNLEIANETGVNTNYISFDMSGFETDALFAATCSSSSGDDAVYDQQFVQQFDLTAIPPGVVYATEIDLDGVYFAEIEILYTNLNAGLADHEAIVNFKMFPNPTSGGLNINLGENESNNFDINITDVSGRNIYNETSYSKELYIDLNNQQSGIYFVKVSSEGKTNTRRLIIQ